MSLKMMIRAKKPGPKKKLNFLLYIDV